MENGIGKWKYFDFGKDLKHGKHENRNNSDESDINVENPFEGLYKLIPNSPHDLSVHPKKIEEIKKWLTLNVLNEQNSKSTCLLISGPAGSAKTTTLKMICKTMAISVLEWSNPIDQDCGLLKGTNQINRLLEFLSDSKWTSLFEAKTTRKIIMVKDFPNAIIYRPEDFSTVLDDCCKFQCHIVFICTDASSATINLTRTIFTESIINKYHITHIRFNPCASSLMKKALKRVEFTVKDNALCKQPLLSTIDAILATSLGDIRSVMNQFHFSFPSFSENGNYNPVHKKRRKNNETTSLHSMPREESLGLFHGLGRVLNPKRNNSGNSWRFNANLEKLVNEFSVQPILFISFLFENYLEYFGNIYEASNAAQIFSFSVQFLDNRIDKQDILVYGLWISILGTMLYNEHKISKWNAIKKPTKIFSCSDSGTRVHPMDCYYYNIINNIHIPRNV